MRYGRPGALPHQGSDRPALRSAREDQAPAGAGSGPDNDAIGAKRGHRPPRRQHTEPGRGPRDGRKPGPRAVPDPPPGSASEAGGTTAPPPCTRDQTRLWHITLSVSGAETPLARVRRGLERLARDHPFLLTGRYATDHAEIRYWEEARDLHDAAAIALRLWGEHRASADLPEWETVGLEVIDRETYRHRIAEGRGPLPATPVGIHPC